MKLVFIINKLGFEMWRDGHYVSSFEFRKNGASLFGEAYYRIWNYERRWKKVFGKVW